MIVLNVKMLELLLKRLEAMDGGRIDFYYGMCFTVIELCEEGLVSESDKELFHSYVDNNRPCDTGRIWWWPCNEYGTKMRISWVKETIELMKNQ